MTTRWNKRKRDDWDEGDPVDERPGAQVLPVARSLPSDGIPRDGSEYLLAVRYASVCCLYTVLLTPPAPKIQTLTVEFIFLLSLSGWRRTHFLLSPK
jgi:hypothetical protein